MVRAWDYSEAPLEDSSFSSRDLRLWTPKPPNTAQQNIAFNREPSSRSPSLWLISATPSRHVSFARASSNAPESRSGKNDGNCDNNKVWRLAWDPRDPTSLACEALFGEVPVLDALTKVRLFEMTEIRDHMTTSVPPERSKEDVSENLPRK